MPLYFLLGKGFVYARALVLSDSPWVVGSFKAFHTEAITAATTTGFFTAWTKMFPNAAQVVISSQLSPKYARIGRTAAVAIFTQNTGLCILTFQLIFII